MPPVLGPWLLSAPPAPRNQRVVYLLIVLVAIPAVLALTFTGLRVADATRSAEAYGQVGRLAASPPVRYILKMARSGASLPLLFDLSARAGVHGATPPTAVPRATLAEALRQLGTLYSTDDPNDLPDGQSFLEVAAGASGGPFRMVGRD